MYVSIYLFIYFFFLQLSNSEKALSTVQSNSPIQQHFDAKNVLYAYSFINGIYLISHIFLAFADFLIVIDYACCTWSIVRAAQARGVN